MADSIRLASTEVLPYHRRHGKAERHDRQKKRLHYACADPETRLSCWAKAANNCVNEHDVNEEQQKLSAGRHTNPQHSPPNLCAWAEKWKTKSQVMIFLFEINYDQHVRDENRNKCGKRRAGYSEFRPRTNSKNQQRRQHDVEQDAEHLKSHGRFNDSSGTQRRPQSYQRKLQ